MSKPFEKFINKEPKGAKKKEAIRQEKRKYKAEARAAGEAMRQQKWEKKQGIVSDVNKYEVNKGKPGAASRPKSKGTASPISHPKSRISNPPSRIPNPVSHIPHPETPNAPGTPMPLNKFVAHSGICGRREAAEIVKQGFITVNGDIIYDPAFRVNGNEDVKMKGKRLFAQKNLVYILVNKPKDYITTAKDPEGRKTILDLVKGATKERVYPVGRLDRNTTGVLLLTNDGELAQKLTHPSYEIKKVYEVKLDKPVAKKDFEAILTGITLEDGFVQADSLAYADDKDKSIVGIEIHSGRNRIVRRIFESLGYDVRGLDRVMFANLTKKNVDRGRWRMLQEKEVRLLKFMNQSFVKKKNAANERH